MKEYGYRDLELRVGAFRNACLEGLRKHKEVEAQKSDGQIAHETFHAKLSELGVESHGGWPTLQIERKAAWEATAKTIRDKRKAEEFATVCGVDPGRNHRNHRDSVVYLLGDLMHGHKHEGKTLHSFPHAPATRTPVRADYRARLDVPPDMVFFDEVDRSMRPAQWAALMDGYLMKPLADLPYAWRQARAQYFSFVGQKIHEALEKEFKNMNKSTTTEDEIKGAQFEIEELRTEVSNLNDELSEVRQERETLRATLDRNAEHATLLEGTVKRLEGHVASAQSERDIAKNNRDEFRKARDSAVAERDLAQKNLATTAEQLDTALLVIDQLVRQRDGNRPGEPCPFDVRRVVHERSFVHGIVELKVVDSREVMAVQANPFVRLHMKVVKAERPRVAETFDAFRFGGRPNLSGDRF